MNVRDRRTELRNRQIQSDAAKEIRGYYQEAIQRFLNTLEYIDCMSGTYAKIRYADVRLRPVQVHGESAKPNGYNREIEIDEIIISGTGE